MFDSLALSKAGLAKLSSSLTLIDLLKNEKECKLECVLMLASLISPFRSCVVWNWRQSEQSRVDMVGAS